MDKTDFPIHVVEVRSRDQRPPGQITSRSKVFGKITPAVRKSLAKQISGVNKSFKPQFAKWPNIPAVAKVTLKEEALAKSHRPIALLTKRTCPIVGTLDYGELLISATQDGLDQLEQRVLSTNAKRPVANITAIESIEPYTLNDWSSKQLEARTAEWLSLGRKIKFHVFDHQNQATNDDIRSALLELADELGIELVQQNYGERVSFYSASLSRKQRQSQQALQSFIGLRSVSPMPEYGPSDFSVMTQSAEPIDDSVLPPPIDDADYPIVGIFDSGVCDECTLLKPWIHATEQYVPKELQDNTHGTMVAGLVASAFSLNQGDERFPKSQAKVIDVQVFEKDTPIAEETLVSIIEEVIPKHPDVNVWNLSLGGDDPAELSEFSDFATFLDEMHDSYGCLFVVASGNHKHMQKWPQTKDVGGLDRVSSPGDSIRGLTVGSLANAHKEKSLSKTDEPSPFSRRGPGPCHVPKPEVSHYGGNCTAKSVYTQTGILSVGPKNALVESLGTSFATPMVASQTAAIWNYLEGNEGTCSAERAKALMVHSALLGEMRVSKDLLNFTGFGRPADIVDALYCDPNAVTFLFDVDLQYGGYEFERWPIPMADDLTTDDGKFRGEIAMTLVYSPIVDKDFSSEYCRTNVDVGMGKYEQYEDEEGELTYGFNSVVPIAPKDVKDLFEKNQIEHGFKWSPVKAYHAVFPRGKDVSTWRLKMKATRRAELPSPEFPQSAVLLITLRALDAEADIYNETIRLVGQKGWVTNAIDSHVRVKLEQ